MNTAVAFEFPYRIQPENLLLRQVRKTSAVAAAILEARALAQCDLEVQQGRIVNARRYLATLTAIAYGSLRYEMYTDPDLLAMMLQDKVLVGLPVPLQTRGLRTAMTLWGRCEPRAKVFAPNRVHLHEYVANASGVFFPRALEYYGLDDETELLAQAVGHTDVGILYACQQLGIVPGQCPHMLLCMNKAVPFDGDTVAMVTLEATASNQFLGGLLHRRGIPVHWLEESLEDYSTSAHGYRMPYEREAF